MYTLLAADSSCGSTGNLALVHSDQTIKYYDGSGSATSAVLSPDSGGFNAQILGVLAGTNPLAVGDKVTFDAKGRITKAEFQGTPTVAIIGQAIGVVDGTLSVSATGLTSFTIPAGRTLTVTGTNGVLGLANTSSALTINGTLLVAKDADNSVTIEKAVITPDTGADAAVGTGTSGNVLVVSSKVELAAGGSITAKGTSSFTVATVTTNEFVLTKGVIANPTNATVTLVANSTAAAAGTVVLPAEATLTLDAGSIALKGTGTLTAGLTAFSCTTDGTWTASGAAVTITSAATGATIAGAGAGATLTASSTGGGPTITQDSGAGNALAIGANTTVNIAGNNSGAVGSIVLKAAASNQGSIAFADTTSIIKTAASGTATPAVGGTGLAIGTKTIAAGGNMTFANIYGNDSSTGALSKIVGASGGGTITATTTTAPTDDVTLAGNKAVAGS
jgi:hypothetical protein